MQITKNILITGKHQKPITTDVFYNKNEQQKPIVIFAHGYKGFKDWGCWDLVAKQFAKNNLFFIKFNFSYNGTTPENPLEFEDLNAFAENNYEKELDDLQSVIDWITTSKDFNTEIDKNQITLIGHSRGGGIVNIKAAEEPKVTKLITWAAVCDFGKRTATIGDLEQWKKDGVKYVLNGRTKQMMPHNYQFYENFKANEKRLTIKRAVEKIKIPYLIIHGSEDTSIKLEEAESLHKWNPNSELLIIENANHVFGAKHPWSEDTLTNPLQKVVEKSIEFI